MSRIWTIRASAELTQKINLVTAIKTWGRRPVLREALTFLAFSGLTIIMTWPWVLMIRDGLPDRGDCYLNSWILWWDYYQTFHDPLNLFQAPIFYPYSYTLAFSEHNYGIALLFFPLFALGLRPITIHGLATLLGFAISAYGGFRLTRTLTSSNGAAWVGGIVFGFAPYRFHQIAHLNYLFAGWIPLLLEALVLFARRRSWSRAIWLGISFTMNAVTCIHWFVLTLVPLGTSAAFLFTRYRIWRDRDLWLRGGATLAVAVLVLTPFFLPYRRVSQIYQISRSTEEAAKYSAKVGNWLSADKQNKFWRGFGPTPETGERALFPGMLPILLLFAALFLSGKRDFDPAKEHDDVKPRSHLLLPLLDGLALIMLMLGLVAYGYGDTGIRLLGLESLRITDGSKPTLLFVLIFLARICIAYPRALRFNRDANLIETIRVGRRPEGFGIGLIWLVIGFVGSLGMNFFFHRALFQFLFIFRSIRVPARWAMLACVGLAVLAGLGAKQVAEALARYRLSPHSGVVFAMICVLLLFELRAAPLDLVRGEVDPDPVTLHLKRTPMRGGIVHIPAGGEVGNYRYVLRQADHQRPLVTAVSGFGTPILTEVESLSSSRPIPFRFLDLLEEIPVSYLVIHYSVMRPEQRLAVNTLIERGMTSGRLRFVGSFGGTGINGNEGAELYAVVKTEPH